MSIDFIRPEVDELRPRISVIGVGGAGGSGDLRDLALGAVVDRKPSHGFIGRLVAAMKGGF